MSLFRSRTRRIDGRQYTVVATAVDEGMRRALDRRPRAVHVCDTDPPIDSLDPLLPWASKIHYLIVTDSSITSIDALEQFTCLRELDLFPSAKAKGTLDARRTPHLESLALTGSLSYSLAGSPALTSLLVENLRERDASQVAALPALRHLRLGRPRAMPTEFASPELESIDIANYRWPTSSGEIHGIERLRRLTLTKVRGLTDLSAFREARQLDEITIEDCSDLSALSGTGISPQANIRLIGSTPARHSG